jgi:hypothetical protein
LAIPIASVAPAIRRDTGGQALDQVNAPAQLVFGMPMLDFVKGSKTRTPDNRLLNLPNFARPARPLTSTLPRISLFLRDFFFWRNISTATGAGQ